MLLHVVDCAASDRDDLMHHVNDVLQQIGADEVPQLIVYNKIDKVEGMSPRIERNADGEIERIWLSASTGEGLELLRQALQEYFPQLQESEYLT